MASSDQKRALLAVLLSGLVLFVWQTYFAPPPIVNITPQVSSSNTAENLNNVTGSPSTKSAIQGSTANPGEVNSPTSEQNSQAANDNAKVITTVELVNAGHNVKLNSHFNVMNFFNPNEVRPMSDTVGKPVGISLLVESSGEKVVPFFELKQGSDASFSGIDSKLGLEVSGTLDENGKLSIFLNSDVPLKYRFKFDTLAKRTEDSRMRELVTYTNESDRLEVGDESKEELQLKWAGLDFNYHFLGLIFNKLQTANVITTEAGPAYVDVLGPSKSLEFQVLYTKKEYNHLKSLGSNLQNAVDFGFFGIVAVFILSGLQKVYSLIPNYGFAIIVLTFIIRLFLFPLQYKSIKSMKNMQKIQPEIQKLKEKFKDNQAALQKETMALFKRTGANPLGGCLPMLLQMPVFFAFYQVLYNAVELVDAPFIMWITDLSIKDPYYVLPVLMGITFFLQTKLNPTPTTDPMQAKMMMFMPIIFTFIMKDLPAGLNLYFTTSTLFGILQQLIVYRFVK